jgi:CheY-like chemotaxis protein
MLLKNKRIFVVEDDPTNLAIASFILKQHGAVVRFDAWGGNAEERIVNFEPDIILLDIHLPGSMTGYDVLKAIRQHANLDTVPIVAVTASDPSTEMNKAREAGFTSYIAKPIRTGTFGKLIAAILNGEPVWGEAE